MTFPKTLALILSGGSGHRLESERPKQYIEIGGETLLRRTLRAFAGRVDHILVVCQDEWRREAEPFQTCQAGETGFGSLRNGVAALSDWPDETLVMIHDAVRPLVSPAVIEDNLRVAREYGNAIASVCTYETLLSAPDGSTVQGMVRRESMYRAQTPQTFTLGTLRQMLREAQERCIVEAQSACTLASQLGYELHLSQGDLQNFKITTPSDLSLYETLIS